MQAEETHWLDNGYVFNIPPKNYHRRVTVPLLLAIAPNGKAKAKHKLYFGGAWVTEAKAEGALLLDGGQVPSTACNCWNGYIEPNQQVSIQAQGESSDGGYVLQGITVFIANE
ncbi:hypothetical protein OHS39_000345 [Klebsiella aerogenes]|uniref:hypothetical protein n=1 Tax=Klebsiella aerogenes TaxID=548 RepID=UPI002DBA9B49|nr:hypothetical protein [Klebsiella aerogenes]EJY9564402.1 hypothetical protein [Klebsiella aerogenes]MEB6598352.1 hypothetical protein [Klebsiella aerogenes]